MEQRLLDDLPAQEPWQGLKDLARRLAWNLPNFPASAPVLVSGDWGLGKTTLLEEIERQILDRRREWKRGGPPSVLHFGAWRYEGELPLLAALVRSIWQALAPCRDLPEYQASGQIWKQLWRGVLSFSAGAGPGLTEAAFGKMGKAVFEGLLRLQSDAAAAPKPDVEQLMEELAEDETTRLWTSFRDFVAKFWPDSKDPLIVLIDDLDRCSPAGAVQLLDALRMILNQAQELNCRFVVALDRKVLVTAVSHKFSDLGHYDGNRYLEKVFPLSFALPRPDSADLKKLLDELLSELKDDSAKEALHRALADPLFSSPRLIKRCINRFLLLLEFEGNGKIDDDERRRRITLVQWMASCERWPALRELLHRRPLEYWEKVKACLDDPAQLPPDAEAKGLLGEQDLPTWLREQLAHGVGRLTEAENRLRQKGL